MRDEGFDELIQPGQEIPKQLGGNLGLAHHLIQPRFESRVHDILLRCEPPRWKRVSQNQLGSINPTIQ